MGIQNFGKNRLTGMVFQDAFKACNTVRVNSLLYKLTVLNFPLYPVKLISSYLYSRTFTAYFLSATSTRRSTQAGVAHGRIITHVLFSLYVTVMSMPSHHVKLAL